MPLEIWEIIMSIWGVINIILTTLASVLVLYQIVYVIVGFFYKKKYGPAKEDHTYGILIAGRNEEAVIGQLIESIKRQDYDQSKLRIFVCADNCSEGDKTAEIARSMGADVFERHDLTKIGKGYALDLLLRGIAEKFPDYHPDGFFVFDADNILEKNYIKEMNKAFDSGEKIITSYRASKNFDESLWSMGASIGFIRECRFTHGPRNFFNLSTHISGTGFLMSSEVINPSDGWKYKKITEDLEFSCDKAIAGYKIAYCDDAVFYDEQPATWKQTYRQRMRWQKGGYQVFGALGLRMILQFFRRLNFGFYDMFITLSPLPMLSTSYALLVQLIKTVKSIFLILGGASVLAQLGSLAISFVSLFLSVYAGMFVYGSLAVLKDWKRIKAKPFRKILSMFAYPLFMITLIPLTYSAIFKKVEWKPIKHNASNNAEQLMKTEDIKK